MLIFVPLKITHLNANHLGIHTKSFSLEMGLDLSILIGNKLQMLDI